MPDRSDPADLAAARTLFDAAMTPQDIVNAAHSAEYKRLSFKDRKAIREAAAKRFAQPGRGRPF